MRTLLLACLPLVALPLLALRATAADPAPRPDVVATALADGRFKTLAAALTRADLVDVLRGAGPFTVFAPTDEAFAALPDGVLATLLRPEGRAALVRVLQAHVVAGRVMASDLLKARGVDTLAGVTFPLGLRVGPAAVVQADVECSNGVIHVIDAVLVPPTQAVEAASARGMADGEVRAVIHAAIEKGVPLFNAGDERGCAAVYRAAAEHLVRHGGEGLADLARADLERALETQAHDASAHAWALRRAFDRILEDAAFEPTLEAALPEGFPAPGPVGRVVRKDYPAYRAARAPGTGMNGAFWTLFSHIKKNNVEMTAPVEMTMGEDMRMLDMAFLYESPSQGSAGRQGAVEVVDLGRVEVLSIGMRGPRSDASIQAARRAVEARLAAQGLEASGRWRVLGYNSPMVPASRQYWELQVPVRAR